MSTETYAEGEIGEAIGGLLRQGRYLEAYEKAVPRFGPPRGWVSAADKLMAADLAGHLGAPRLAQSLCLRAHRQHREDPRARFRAAAALSDRGDHWAAWRLLGGGPVPGAAGGSALERLGRATAAAALGDIPGAEVELAGAEEVFGGAEEEEDRAALHLAHAQLAARAGDFAGALEAADDALDACPHHAAAMALSIRLRIRKNQGREALERVRAAAARAESAPLLTRQLELEFELGERAEAAATLARIEALCRLSEPAFTARIEAWKRLLEPASGPAGEQDAPGGSAGAGDGARRLEIRLGGGLAVPRLAASMAALEAYWGEGSESAWQAGALQCDGTLDSAERRWAAGGGWRTREFRPGWEAVVGLIDRGVPLLLTTYLGGAPEASLVIGYHLGRRALVLASAGADPHEEQSAGELLERPGTLPGRCLACVPVAEENRLTAASDLPEAGMHDRLGDFHTALSTHRREAAAGIVEALETEAPDHPLTLRAEVALAAYDRDPNRRLAFIESLLVAAPSDPWCLRERVVCLRLLGRHREAGEVLRNLGRAGGSYPVEFGPELALETARDLRHRAEGSLLRRTRRGSPHDPLNYLALAAMEAVEGGAESAVAALRFAAFLSRGDDEGEAAALRFFRSSRALGDAEAEAALTALNARGGSAADVTYLRALGEAGRSEEAEALTDGLADSSSGGGALLLAAALRSVGAGDSEEAGQFLERARPAVPLADWHRTAAVLASAAGDDGGAAAAWRAALAEDPVSGATLSATADAVAVVEGDGAALELAAGHAAEQPDAYEIGQVHLDRVARADPGGLLAAWEAFARRNPEDVGALARVVEIQLASGNTGAATDTIKRARSLHPGDPGLLALDGLLHLRRNQRPTAGKQLRAALSRSVDCAPAVRWLVASSRERRDVRTRVKFALSELGKQSTRGPAVEAIARAAAARQGTESYLHTLGAMVAKRPRSPLPHGYRIRFLLQSNRSAEALEEARSSLQRFPLDPGILGALARVLLSGVPGEGGQGARAEALELLRRAQRLRPDDPSTTRLLADHLAAAGEVGEALALVERGACTHPENARFHFALAGLRWRQGGVDAAVEALLAGLRRAPEDAFAWARLTAWLGAGGRLEEAHEFAAAAAARDPKVALHHANLARVLTRENRTKEALDAANAALALDPRSVPAADAKAEVLCALRHFEEAAKACKAVATGHGREGIAFRYGCVDLERGRAKPAAERLFRHLLWEPEEAAAWVVLYDACRALKRWEEALCAARQAVVFDPHDPRNHALLGEALLEVGRRDEAKSAFETAYELAPDKDFGTARFFKLLADDKEVGAHFRELVAKRAETAEGGGGRLGQMSRAGDAAEAFEQVAADATANASEVAAAAEALRLGHSPAEAFAVLERCVRRPAAHPAAGRAWVAGALAAGKERYCRQQLGKLKGNRALLHQVHHALVERFLETRNEPAFFRHFERHRQTLRETPELWASAGVALVRFGAHQGADIWFEPWRAQIEKVPGVAPAVLAAKAGVNDWTACADVLARAAALGLTAGGSTPNAEVVLYDALLSGERGRVPDLAAALEDIGPEMLSPPLRPLLAPARWRLRALGQGRDKKAADKASRAIGKALAEAREESVAAAHVGNLFLRLLKETNQLAGNSWFLAKLKYRKLLG